MSAKLVMRAQKRWEDAAKALVAEVERAIPEGTRVGVSRGRGVMRGVVTSHGSWWHRPSSFTLQVDSSGRYTTCDYEQIVYIAGVDS